MSTKQTQICAKNNAATKLRIIEKNFQDEELPHELFLAGYKQKWNQKIWSAFCSEYADKYYRTYTKAQISKTIQSDGSLRTLAR